MSFRMVAATLLALTSVASADDELALTPSCAEVDATRDVRTEADQALARGQLVRVLQGLDLLVVETGCIDHYVLSHEQDGTDAIVRIAGPAGVRRIRNPTAAPRAVYERLVTALIEAQAEAIEKAKQEAIDTAETAAADVAIEPTETTYQSDTIAADSYDTPEPDSPPNVRTDTIVYGQVAASSVGTGVGLGARVPFGKAFAFDVSLLHASGDPASLNTFGAKLLRLRNPGGSASSYYGAGISVGERTDAFMGESVGGMQFDGAVGYMFNRTGDLRGFVQAELSLPLYEASPAFIVSVGAGM